MRDQAAVPVILVLAPNWLGDVVMTSPLLSRLAAARGADGRRPAVHLAVRRPWAPLFDADPRLASVVIVEREGRHAGPAGLLRLGADLRRVAPWAIVVGPPSLRAGLAARLSGAAVRVGYRGEGRGPLLTAAPAKPARGERHHSRELADLGDLALAACGLLPDAGGQAEAWGLLPACAAVPGPAADQGPPVWVLAPGTTYGEAKIWPLEQARRFADVAVAERGVRLVLLGDAAAADFAAAMRRGSPSPWRDSLAGPAGIVDLCGRTSLAAAAGLLRGAAAFVGNDSGLMHLSGALGVPTVGLFGSTNPAWTAPLGRATRVLAADGFPCRPCYRRTCNQDRFCLATIDAATVLAAVDDLCGRAPRGRP